jgi:hypothetical protein
VCWNLKTFWKSKVGAAGMKVVQVCRKHGICGERRREVARPVPHRPGNWRPAGSYLVVFVAA